MTTTPDVYERIQHVRQHFHDMLTQPWKHGVPLRAVYALGPEITYACNILPGDRFICGRCGSENDIGVKKCDCGLDIGIVIDDESIRRTCDDAVLAVYMSEQRKHYR